MVSEASYDLKAVRWNIQGGFYDTACFLAQQAGEKALKSILYYQGARRTALLTHSLLEMTQEAVKKLSSVGSLFGEARARLALYPFPLQRITERLSASILWGRNSTTGLKAAEKIFRQLKTTTAHRER